MSEKILLGYEVKTAEQVSIKPSHMIVTGLTQLSGKTTTLEAMIKRSGLRAIAFKTKVGETGFSEGFIIRPFFQEKSDWQYVESLIEATMKERMRFERNWIIRASKGTKSLKEVFENCQQLERQARGGLEKGIYTNLIAYLELILPQMEKTEFSKELRLKDGVNIMDLEKLSDEVQSLVIRSVIEYVLKNETNTIVIIPEAWKFLPQDRGSPVKYAAEAFIRQGATNKNFLWIDSQDIAGVDKTILKQVANWVLGLQTEKNEVQHTLDQIPLPKAMKPDADEIMTLKIGHFIVCNPDFTKKVYVVPSWLDDETAKQIALNQLPVEAVIGKKRLKLKDITKFDEIALSALREEIKKSSNIVSKIERENSILKSRLEEMKLKMIKLKPDRSIEKKYNIIVGKLKKFIEELETTYVAEEPVWADDSSEEIKTETHAAQPQTQIPQNYAHPSVPIDKNMILTKLGGQPRKLYETLMQNSQGLTRVQLSLMSGYSINSGGFSSAISKLKKMRLITTEGENLRVV